jgi:hypothetical protein
MTSNGIKHGPLTPTFFKALRKAQGEFLARGGKHCHCGGLIYPGERYTCTHSPDGKYLSRAEIAAIRDAWALDGNGAA